MLLCRSRGLTGRQNSYSVESTIERGRHTSPLYVGGTKSLENLIKEARRELGQEQSIHRGQWQLGGDQEEEEVYLDMATLQRQRERSDSSSDYLEMEKLAQHFQHLGQK